MSTLIYTWGTDQHGQEGWIVKGMPHFDVSGPDLIAHDVLEHLPRGLKHGPGADEAMAIGARLYLRVASGWWYGQSFGLHLEPAGAWASEFHNILVDGNYAPAVDAAPIEVEDGEEDMDAVLVEAARKAAEEAADDLGDFGTSDTDFCTEAKTLANWARIGYRAAQKRYKDHSGESVMWMAECLIKEAIQYRNGQEGDRLIIKVNEKNLEFTVTHRSLYDW